MLVGGLFGKVPELRMPGHADENVSDYQSATPVKSEWYSPIMPAIVLRRLMAQEHGLAREEG
jgi:hypothetical protein